ACANVEGTRLQHTVQGKGWSYVCRTGCHRTAWWDGETFRLDTLGACSKPGTLIALSEVWFTRAEYGPILLICCWAKGCKEPLYLVTNMDTAEDLKGARDLCRSLDLMKKQCVVGSTKLQNRCL